MHQCPKCSKMTAEKDLYTDELVCYNHDCYNSREDFEAKPTSLQESDKVEDKLREIADAINAGISDIATLGDGCYVSVDEDKGCLIVKPNPKKGASISVTTAEPVKYPGPEEYTGISLAFSTYTCHTCKEVTHGLYYTTTKCALEASQICPDCYEKHVVEPYKKEKEVEEKIVYPGPEEYELYKPTRKFLCFTCDTLIPSSAYRLTGIMGVYDQETWYLCPDCYDKHVVEPYKKEEEVEEKIVYPGPEEYESLDTRDERNGKFICNTCKQWTHSNPNSYCIASVMEIIDWPFETRWICQDCYDKHVVEPAKEKPSLANTISAVQHIEFVIHEKTCERCESYMLLEGKCKYQMGERSSSEVCNLEEKFISRGKCE